MPIFFNSSQLPPPTNEYVLWLDVMGTRSIMTRSLNVTANYVCKLHVACLNRVMPSIKLYPVMDGLYVTSQSRSDVTTFLRNVFADLADELINSPNEHKFLAKCAVAFGPIIHGCNIPPASSNELNANQPHRNCILLGMPMVQAVQSEQFAPPFGIYIHESARAFAPPNTTPFSHVLWKWWGQNPPANFPQGVTSYFNWCMTRPHSILYEKKRLEAHIESFNEYIAL